MMVVEFVNETLSGSSPKENSRTLKLIKVREI